jgi:hypothetical protein
MTDTYHVDQHTRNIKRRRRRILAGVALVLLLGSFIWAKQTLTTDTVIHQSQPYSTTVGVPGNKLKTYNLANFQIGLPSDWVTQTPVNLGADYSWHGTAKGETARSLEIYEDEIPADRAVNRLLPIKAEGDGVVPTDSVSDNCVNFTDVKTADPHTGAAPSKWSGVNFLCDTASASRVVVGTSSDGAINSVTANGVKGSHRYFFIYTDHSAQPNFEIFTQALASFKAL